VEENGSGRETCAWERSRENNECSGRRKKKGRDKEAATPRFQSEKGVMVHLDKHFQAKMKSPAQIGKIVGRPGGSAVTDWATRVVKENVKCSEGLQKQASTMSDIPPDERVA